MCYVFHRTATVHQSRMACRFLQFASGIQEAFQKPCQPVVNRLSTGCSHQNDTDVSESFLERQRLSDGRIQISEHVATISMLETWYQSVSDGSRVFVKQREMTVIFPCTTNPSFEPKVADTKNCLMLPLMQSVRTKLRKLSSPQIRPELESGSVRR